MEGESGANPSTIDKLLSLDMLGAQWKVKVVLLEVSLMKLILSMSKQIKWKVKVVLLKVSLMNFIVRISKEIERKEKVVLLQVSLMNFTLGISN